MGKHLFIAVGKHLFSAAWLLAAGAAHAELRVSYDVDLKSFTKGVAAGDTLSVDLHTNSDCTALLLSTDLAVGSEDLRVEEVKPVAAKGQRPKPKKIARLSARLQTAATSIPLFALVSGSDGPLAGCQAQARSLPPSPLWIGAYEFDGISDTTSWFHSSAGDVSNGGSQDCMHAPIRLPDGAILLRFEAYVRDSVPQEIIGVSISRHPLDDVQGAELAVGSSIDQLGRQIVTGEVTTGATVDNTQFHYFVQFCWGGPGFGGGEHGVWAVAVHFE